MLGESGSMGLSALPVQGPLSAAVEGEELFKDEWPYVPLFCVGCA
jgi:hypothetical protein